MAPEAHLPLVNGLWDSSEGRGGEGRRLEAGRGNADSFLICVLSRFLRPPFCTLVTGILLKKKKKACTIIFGWETKPNQALWVFFVQNLPEPLIC